MNTTHTFTNAGDALAFVLGGNAYLTLQSAKTGVRYTYRVARNEDKPMYFVSLLTGANNTSDYTYMGILRTEGAPAFRTTKKSAYAPDSRPVAALDYVLRALASGSLPVNCDVYHEGRCGRCGRTLTVPESITSGFGPDCASKMAA